MSNDIGRIDNIIDLKKEEKKKKPYPFIMVERETLHSKAWFDLGGVATQIYTCFLMKRQIIKTGKKGHMRDECINNGKIIFTYAEAKKKYGITQPRFTRAIDDLIRHGFIEINKSASGMFKSTTMYIISERWRLYGTPQFKAGERPMGADVGFRKKNKKEQIREQLS